MESVLLKPVQGAKQQKGLPVAALKLIIPCKSQLFVAH